MRAIQQALRVGSFEEAVRLLEKSANGGNAEAAYQLSSLFRNGRGVARDDVSAFHWMQEAAKTGHVKAQYAVGQMYLAGVGVVSDRAKAELWLNKALAGGHDKAKELLEKIAATNRVAGITNR